MQVINSISRMDAKVDIDRGTNTREGVVSIHIGKKVSVCVQKRSSRYLETRERFAEYTWNLRMNSEYLWTKARSHIYGHGEEVMGTNGHG